MDPAEAAARLLESLGVPPHRVPAGLDARAALLRTELAGRRMLVLLDNARDTAQVRPLLPGTGTCLVLVTSRDRLAGLIASDGATPITLGGFTPDEARHLLTRRLGTARTTADPGSVDEIISRCDGLPLALAIVAARAAAHPHLPMRDLAAGLRRERTVPAWSYHALTATAARLFRLLGLHPGADIPVAAAASLAGAGRVRPLLGELVRAGLLAEPVPGRFAFHDVLRSYATELAHTVEPDPDRSAATARLRDHYLHTAHRAALLLAPGRDPVTLAAPEPGTTPEPLTDQDRAMAWCTAEHRTLQALLDRGDDLHTWQLAWTLDPFQRRLGRVHDRVATRRTALTAAERLADPAVLARTHRDLGHALTGADRQAEARAHFTCALDGYADLGDLVGQATVERGIGATYTGSGQYDKTLQHCLRAEELYRAAGHRPGIAQALNEIGSMHAKLGEFRLALPRCEQALALFRALGDRPGEAACLAGLGGIHHGLGDHARAIEHYQQTVDLWVTVGDRGEEAATLIRLGDVHDDAGEPDAAGTAWRAARSILREAGRPTAEIEARLHG
ncbi:tetratricopeptide repeat protein [Dactylosporangium cerinum]